MAFRLNRRFLDLMCPADKIKIRKADEEKARKSPCWLDDIKIVTEEPNIRLQLVRRKPSLKSLAKVRSPYTNTWLLRLRLQSAYVP